MTFNLNIAPDTLDLEAPLVGRWFCTNANPNTTAGGTASTLSLPAVGGGDLGIGLTAPANTVWLPPALGTLSLYVAGGGLVPPQLAHLRNAAGIFPFTARSVVAHFTLLPAVAERLYQLTRFVPAINAAPTASAGTAYAGDPAPTRVKVAALTLVLPTTINTMALLWPLIPQPDQAVQNALDDDDKRARFVGLANDASGNLTNGPSPMSWLRRPGYFTAPAVLDPREDRLLINLPSQAGATCTMWAFDDRGRPIDPGAVAAWWGALTVAMIQFGGAANTLRAPGFNDAQGPWQTDASGAAAVCLAAAGVTVHLVNAHEGPLVAPFIEATAAASRLTSGGTGVTSNLITGTAAVTLGITNAPAAGNDPNNPSTPDTAPVPRIALLPNNAYAVAPLTLWPGPAGGGGGGGTAGGSRLTDYAPLARDFARVAVVDIERHLVGLDRAPSTNQAPAAGTSDLNVRRADQNRVSTRITVGQVTSPAGTPVLLTDADAVTAAALTLIGTQPAGTRRLRMVAPVADAQWGTTPPLTPIANLAAATGALPVALAESPPSVNAPALAAGQYRVHPLAGDGATSAGGTTVGQLVFVEIQLTAPAPVPPPSALAGAWVRAWPLGFDLESALHRRMAGGAGLVDATGMARLVMALPNDQNNDAAPCGFDLTISFLTAVGGRMVARSFGDLRFVRPAAPGGAPVAITIGGSIVHVCEAGIRLDQTAPPAGLPWAVVPPGATVVEEINGVYTLVDRTTIPTAGNQFVYPAGPPPAPGVVGNLLAIGNPPAAPVPSSIALTQPAYEEELDRADPIGRLVATSVANGPDPLGGLATLAGVTVDRVARTVPEAALRSSYPFRGCERLEVALTNENANTNTLLGVIGSVPCLPRNQEAGPHHLGHPGAATAEISGTGIALTGPATVPLVELTYERTAGVGMPQLVGLAPEAQWALFQSELAVIAEAALATGTIVTGGTATPPTPWAAVLRTVAPHMEGIPGLDLALDQVSFHASQDELNDFVTNTLVPALNNISTDLGTTVSTAITTSTALQFVGRALDQRLRARRGARDLAYSLAAAIGRAEDFIYIETPAIDTKDHGPAAGGGNRIHIWQALESQLDLRPSLHAVLCVPVRMVPGTPIGLASIRDLLLLEAIDDLRSSYGDRVAVFCPGAGGDRPLYLASTTVVIDDVYAVTGTTHLWRRGLTFDSSLACALFDENLTDNRCTEVARFRTALMARRLGVPVGMLPDDPADLTRAVRELDQRGSERLAAIPIKRPKLPPNAPTESDYKIWNPDGSDTSTTIDQLITALLGGLGFAPSFTDGNPSSGNP